MRISQDASSWKARSILRRDFRHDFGTPEVPTGHPKRKKKQPRTRIDHKHVWVEEKPIKHHWMRITREWYVEKFGYDPVDREDIPSGWISYRCDVEGCQARDHKPNPRYAYEMWKRRRARLR